VIRWANRGRGCHGRTCAAREGVTDDGDEQFYKRARDLGLDVQFVGTGKGAVNTANYVPKPVQIPPR
jgi:hypothetical protein